MAKEFELIGDIRGRGTLLGIEFVTDRVKKTPADRAVSEIFEFCLSRGLIFQIRGVRDLKNVIRLVPPMTASKVEVDRAMSIIFDALRAVTKGRRKKRTKRADPGSD
jgi:4-aminobutyrate aminotransferase-like enzyme